MQMIRNYIFVLTSISIGYITFLCLNSIKI